MKAAINDICIYKECRDISNRMENKKVISFPPLIAVHKLC